MNDVDPNIVITILRQRIYELEFQLTLYQAKDIQNQAEKPADSEPLE